MREAASTLAPEPGNTGVGRVNSPYQTVRTITPEAPRQGWFAFYGKLFCTLVS